MWIQNLTAVVLFHLFAFAQQELHNRMGEVYYTPNSYLKKYNVSEGSPYLNDAFLPAKINDIKENKFVRFDAHEDNIEIKINENKVMLLPESEAYVIAI